MAGERDRTGKLIVAVPWIIFLVIVLGAGVMAGRAYEKGQGEKREMAQYRLGKFEEAEAILSAVESERQSAERDEQRAHSAIERAEARGRIDALMFIEHEADDDKAESWNGVVD